MSFAEMAKKNARASRENPKSKKADSKPAKDEEEDDDEKKN